MCPTKPKRCLAAPVAWLQNVRGSFDLVAQVDEPPLDHHEHAARNLALVEEHITLREELLIQSRNAELGHCDGAVGEDLLEEGVCAVLLEEFLPEAHAQGLRQKRQQIHLLLLHTQALPAHRKLQVACHARAQVGRDVVLPQVLAQEPELPLVTRIELPQRCDRRGDAAEEGAEYDQRTDQNEHREGSLAHVHGLHGHRSGGELRQRPMQRGHVFVWHRHVPEVGGDPSVHAGHQEGPQPVPCASNEVVCNKEEGDMLYDVHHQKHVLRIYAHPDLGHHSLQLGQPQKPDEAKEPQCPEERANFHDIRAANLEDGEQVYNDHHEVKREPRSQVPSSNFTRLHDKGAIPCMESKPEVRSHV
mmetsp:Transcript_73147/g.169637  ORF Transcript_73147/g.169637 Transcript_73147/m.169637 type:complete len:360 (-) Transcript_73147:799-1878(-)